MLKITFSTKSYQKNIHDAIRYANNWEPFFEKWAELFYDSREEMFATAGRSTGTPWKMYSRATNEHQYAAVKSSILGHRMTEKDLLRWSTGHEYLYPSLTSKNAPHSLYALRGRELTIGTNLEYAGKLDLGNYIMPEWAGSYRGVQRQIMALGMPLLKATEKLADKQAVGIERVVDGGSQQVARSLQLLRGVRYG